MPGTTFDIDAIAAGGGRVLRFENGAAIYGRGDPGDCAFIVARGRVRIGNGVPIEILRPGRSSARTHSSTRARAWLRPRPRARRRWSSSSRIFFFLLCRDDSDFSDAVMRLMARRLRATLSALDRVTGDGRPDLRVMRGRLEASGDAGSGRLAAHVAAFRDLLGDLLREGFENRRACGSSPPRRPSPPRHRPSAPRRSPILAHSGPRRHLAAPCDAGVDAKPWRAGRPPPRPCPHRRRRGSGRGPGRRHGAYRGSSGHRGEESRSSRPR